MLNLAFTNFSGEPCGWRVVETVCVGSYKYFTFEYIWNIKLN